MSNPDAGPPPIPQSLGTVELEVATTETALHPVDSLLAQHPALVRDHIRNLERTPDDTITLFYQLHGDSTAAHGLFDAAETVSDYRLSQSTETIHAYLHVEASDPLTTLVELPLTHGVIPTLPFAYTVDGTLRVTVVGDTDAIRDLQAASPAVFSVAADTIDGFNPATTRLVDQLTDRQRETLQAAVELGYYRTPRQATLEEIGDAIDRTDGTVGDHLRTVEALVMDHIVP